MTDQSFDQAKAEAFAQRMLGALNDASLTLMVVVGHKVGLFDTMATLPPSTSGQIAAAAGLNERYVREWLGAMVTGRTVDYDPTAKTYHLPPEHAASLTRAAGPSNMAIFMQYVPMMASVEKGIIESFRNGGGVPYAAFTDFHTLMVEQSSVVQEASLLTTTLPAVPGQVDRLQRGVEVLDVGCGSGHALNLMARAFPQSRFTGYDFSAEGIAAGRAEAHAWGLTNAQFAVKDVATLDERSRYDFITAFDSIHDQAKPRAVLKGIAQALRPEGTFLLVDVAASSQLEKNLDHVIGPFLYGISTFHCMTVSLALEGEGLGTVWGEQKARELLHEAGFTQVDVKRVEKDVMNNYYIAQKH
jgi:2-polyprenyl-3-methyl-5-hydroxy-6-metoxy-1,4-benzoquinol methylase